MTNDSPFDLRYASREEHFALRERVAVLETEIKPALLRIEARLDKGPAPSGAPDHAALALHRLADIGERMLPQKQGDPWTARLIAASVICACAIIGYRLIVGHW